MALFDMLTGLQYRVKALKAENAALKSGDKYRQMEEQHRKENAHNARIIARQKREIADAHKETVTVRNIWMDMVDNMAEELKKKDDIIQFQQDTIRKEKAEKYEVLVALEEEREKNRKLQAQLNRDYENSSRPSSMSPNHKKISNNREKTGRKQGGQPGHEGHTRKRRVPDKVVPIVPSPDYLDTSKYRATGTVLRKQMVSLKVTVETVEYETPEFIEIATGKKAHMPFPAGVVDDVNYDGSVRAFAFLLNNNCNVSIGNVRKFLSELTDGDLTVSTGMINNLSRQFSYKTEYERKEIFNRLLASPVMHIDATNARMNGKSMQVFVCSDTSAKNTLFFGREHKGHEGVKDTPAELYAGILVHDHDKTFYRYGSDHQECLQHVLRYLLDSVQNEPNLKWNSQMRALIQEMIHYRNGLCDDAPPNKEAIADFERRYDKILALARNEYEDVPPSEYYMDGYNLYLRLQEYKHNHLLFLSNHAVPPTNNLSERHLRGYKRKQKEAMSFRSKDAINHLCNCLGVVNSLCAKGENLYKAIAEIFDRTATLAPT